MKTNPSIPSILAGVGVGSLLIYVLACATSFSPDDRHVLYPSFDTQSGAVTVAVYDRKAGRSETVFTAVETAAATNQHSALIRAGWLPDGKHILVASMAGDSGLDLLVLARGVNEPVRRLALSEKGQGEATLAYPFAIHDDWLFLNGNDRNPMRINLATGETTGGDKTTNEIIVLPSSQGQSLVAFRGLKNNAGTEFGTFDPRTMEFKPSGNTGTNVSDETMPAFNPADGRLVFVSKAGEQLRLEILKDGKLEFTRPLVRGGAKLEVGPFLEFAPDGKTILTVYCATAAATTNSEYGLLEIPLNDAPPRFTPLFSAAFKDESGLMYAQPSVSHDGKTWAIGTACLYLQNKSLQPQDCALFLVDLSKAKRPVTKIPIPVPAERKPSVR
jgi:hypothetical protein